MSKLINNQVYQSKYLQQRLTNQLTQQSQKQKFYLSIVRKLNNKKYLDSKDIKDLIKFIDNYHISSFSHLQKIFKNLQDQLTLGDLIYQSIQATTPNYDKIADDNVFLSKYINKGAQIDKKLFYQLYQAIQKKFILYKDQRLWELFVHQTVHKEFHEDVIKDCNVIPQFQSQILMKNMFPEAYCLKYTIRFQLKFMRDIFASKNIKDSTPKIQENYSLKDRLVAQIFRQINYKTINNDTSITQKYQKHEKNKFISNQYFDMKEFSEKLKFLMGQFDLESNFFKHKSHDVLINSHEELISTQCKCFDCLRCSYKEVAIPRQRNSIVYVYTLNSSEDLKRQQKKFREVLQGLMNNNNGGLIFLDCTQKFFYVQPSGVQMILSKKQSKKQSISDLCSNYFKELNIKPDYSIDFLLVQSLEDNAKDKNISRREKSFASKNGQKYITRLKIKSQASTNLQIQIQYPQQKSQKGDYAAALPNCYMLQNHYNKQMNKYQITKQMRKRHLVHLSNNNIQINFKQILDQLQENEILELIQGRRINFIKHQSICHQPNYKIGYSTQKSTADNSLDSSTESLRQQQITLNLYRQIQESKKKLPYSNLLIVNVGQKNKIQSQLRDLFSLKKPKKGSKQIQIKVQAPFFQNEFIQSSRTLLVRSSLHTDQLSKIIMCQQAQKRNYLRSYKQKQDIWSPFIYIKVHQYVKVEYHIRLSHKQLIQLKLKLQQSLYQYWRKQQKWHKNCKAKIFQSKQRKEVLIYTDDTSPSYALLYIFLLMKNILYSKEDKFIKQVRFKEQKQFKKQSNQYIELDCQMESKKQLITNRYKQMSILFENNQKLF